jgi:hypothetical protein
LPHSSVHRGGGCAVHKARRLIEATGFNRARGKLRWEPNRKLERLDEAGEEALDPTSSAFEMVLNPISLASRSLDHPWRRV